MPQDATSLEELELMVDRLSHRENRWGTYQRIAERAYVSVPPDEIWMLVQICSQGEGVRLASLADQFSISRRKLQIVAKRLVDRNLLIRQPDNAFLASERGRQTFERDRKSVVEGKRVSVRVDFGGRRIIKTKNTKQQIIIKKMQ